RRCLRVEARDGRRRQQSDRRTSGRNDISQRQRAHRRQLWMISYLGAAAADVSNKEQRTKNEERQRRTGNAEQCEVRGRTLDSPSVSSFRVLRCRSSALGSLLLLFVVLSSLLAFTVLSSSLPFVVLSSLSPFAVLGSSLPFFVLSSLFF